MRRTARFGPGILIAAAFIGPGTVTTASRAGAGFGTALLWTVLFSIVATVVLQEMSARLGIVTRAGLGEALRSTFSQQPVRAIVLGLVIAAIAFGNAAYEAGNLSGAAVGLALITPVSFDWWILLVSAAGGGLLLLGGYGTIERFMIVLVALMSAAFVITAFMVKPAPTLLAQGLVPRLPEGSWGTVIALIGTTVVPYNLFLHANAVGRKWGADVPIAEGLRRARTDTLVSISLGGAVTAAILVTAAGCFPAGTRISSAADMADQLTPLLGSAARAFFAVGIFAAGLTSTITAPLAAAYATSGALGWPCDTDSRRFRLVWAGVLLAGVGGALAKQSPVAVILFAQAANGLLLPMVAVFLIVVVNRTGLLGRYTNGALANIAGVAVVAVVAGLASLKLYDVWLKAVGPVGV